MKGKVYVDSLMNHGMVIHGQSIPTCHMFTDADPDVLHGMADRVGAKPAWFMVSRSGIPHYDLTRRFRNLAVQFGAIEVTKREAIPIWKEILNNIENQHYYKRNRP